MSTQNVQLLVDALRSGEFLQGSEALRKGDKYCCLGVACEIYRRHTGRGEWGISALDNVLAFRFLNTGAGDISFLPKDVREWFGFRLGDPMLDLGHNSFWRSAIDLNDSGKASFAEIADAFERTFIKKGEQDAETSVSD